MGLKQLLRRHRFSHHPFDSWIAEDERNLPEWFVRPAFLDTILGDTGDSSKPLTPRSHIVYGRPGDGKTAIRLTVEKELELRAPNALVLRYTDFTNPLSGTTKPTLAAHVDELLRLGTVALIALWQNNPDVYGRLSLGQKQDLAWLVKQYYEGIPPDVREAYTSRLSPLNPKMRDFLKSGAKIAVEAYNATISLLNKEKIEPVQWDNSASSAKVDVQNPFLGVQRLWSLANAMAIDSIWVMVDSVDEAPKVNTAQGIYDCLSELLLSQTLLTYRADNRQVICFKVFLTHPTELQPLLQAARFRADRIKSESISWQRKDLNDALTRRLVHFSNRSVLNFDDICVPEAAGTHDRLLDSCDRRPRTLFRMAHEIFADFQRTSDGATEKIGRSSIDAGIATALAAVVG